VPGEVLDVLRAWRPTPLVRARRLERALDTPARIYAKDESRSPSGGSGPNTAVPQAFYNVREGTGRLVTGSHSGRWGSAVALACALFDLDCTVYLATSAAAGHRRRMIETWGARVEPSPDARAAAVADAAARSDTRHASQSVLLHQTVIGLEAREQLAAVGEGPPDVVIGSCAEAADLAGITLPFVPDADVRLMAVEPAGRPMLTSGRFDPSGRVAPAVAALVRAGRMEAVAYPETDVVDAVRRFARTQGPVAGQGTGYAVRATVDEALLAREEGVARVVLFAWSG
jgi:tryptophan synthase beta chain